MLERAVDAFEGHPDIDQVVIVADPDEMERVEKIIQNNSWKKVAGSVRVQPVTSHHVQSSRRLNNNRRQPDNSLTDAARPLVSARIISEVIEKLKHCRAEGWLCL